MDEKPRESLGKIRSITIVYFLSLITLGLYSIYWWYKINDEVRKHNPKISVRPWASAIAFSILGIVPVFVPHFATVYNTARRIGKMESECGAPRVLDADRVIWLYISAWLSILLLVAFFPIAFFLFYFFVAEIQDNLNAHWKWHLRREATARDLERGQAAA